MKLLNYLKGLLWTIGLIVILSLIVTIFHYFNILNTKGLEYAYLLVPIFSILMGAVIVGKNSKEKGFLEGIKMGIIYLGIMTILSLLIFKSNFELKVLLYDAILLLTAMLGSMIGINFKAKN